MATATRSTRSTSTTRRVAKKTTATPARKRTTPAKKVAASAKQHSVGVASVPEARYAKEYIGRKFGSHSDYQVFDKALENFYNVLIEGPTGPGKTSAALGYAAKRVLRFYAIPSNIGIEPSQLFGKFVPSPNGGFVWQDGPVTDIIRNGGVLLINEVNFMPERVGTVLFGLLDKRREIVLLDHHGEKIAAHRGKGKCWCDEKNCDSKRVLVMADMNPAYEGTRPLNKAFRNRFAIQLNWDYDVTVEAKLLKSASLLNMADQMREEGRRGGLRTPVSTNMLQEFENVYDIFGMDFAIENFVNHFYDDERAAVRQTVRTFETNIEDELVEDEEADDVDDDSEDEEDWGIEGVDWVYEDEAGE